MTFLAFSRTNKQKSGFFGGGSGILTVNVTNLYLLFFPFLTILPSAKVTLNYHYGIPCKCDSSNRERYPDC